MSYFEFLYGLPPAVVADEEKWTAVRVRFSVDPSDYVSATWRQKDGEAGRAASQQPKTSNKASVDSGVGDEAVAMDVKSCQASLAECTAKNPIYCPYHGAMLVQEDIRKSLTAAGIRGRVDVEAEKGDTETGKGFSVTVRCPESQADTVKKQLQAFMSRPGITPNEDEPDLSYDRTDKGVTAFYDIDTLKADEPPSETETETSGEETNSEEAEPNAEGGEKTPAKGGERTDNDGAAETVGDLFGRMTLDEADDVLFKTFNSFFRSKADLTADFQSRKRRYKECTKKESEESFRYMAAVIQNFNGRYPNNMFRRLNCSFVPALTSDCYGKVIRWAKGKENDRAMLVWKKMSEKAKAQSVDSGDCFYTINGRIPKEEWDEATIHHEMAHVVRHYNQSLSDEFDECVRKADAEDSGWKSRISPYAKTNNDELHSESVSYVLSNSYRKGTLPKCIEDYVHRNICGVKTED